MGKAKLSKWFSFWFCRRSETTSNFWRLKSELKKIQKTCLRCFCGDAPARAFILVIIYHNGKHMWPRYDSLSDNSPKSIFCGNSRTDETITQRVYREHHYIKSGWSNTFYRWLLHLPGLANKMLILLQMFLKMFTVYYTKPNVLFI